VIRPWKVILTGQTPVIVAGSAVTSTPTTRTPDAAAGPDEALDEVVKGSTLAGALPAGRGRAR
jgi:hypothetical protein